MQAQRETRSRTRSREDAHQHLLLEPGDAKGTLFNRVLQVFR